MRLMLLFRYMDKYNFFWSITLIDLNNYTFKHSTLLVYFKIKYNNFCTFPLYLNKNQHYSHE